MCNIHIVDGSEIQWSTVIQQLEWVCTINHLTSGVFVDLNKHKCPNNSQQHANVALSIICSWPNNILPGIFTLTCHLHTCST